MTQNSFQYYIYKEQQVVRSIILLQIRRLNHHHLFLSKMKTIFVLSLVLATFIYAAAGKFDTFFKL